MAWYETLGYSSAEEINARFKEGLEQHRAEAAEVRYTNWREGFGCANGNEIDAPPRKDVAPIPNECESPALCSTGSPENQTSEATLTLVGSATPDQRNSAGQPTDPAAMDFRAYYDERAAIAEYEAGLPRPEAEARAFECCVALWLNRHHEHTDHERTDPTRCAHCGQPDSLDPGGTLLPFGTESAGHAWLHSACWPAWHAARQAMAKAALTAMGIVAPVGV